MVELRQFLPLLIPVVVIQFGLLIFALVDVIRRERFRLLPKWGWFIVCFVSFVGPILYFALGRDE